MWISNNIEFKIAIFIFVILMANAIFIFVILMANAAVSH